MATAIGKNTLAGDELRSYVERVEAVDKQKKQLGEDRKAIMAEAVSRGFVTKGINFVLKLRKKKPHDLQEEEALADVYRHAMGLDVEPPLFRQIQGLAKDAVGGAALIEAFKQLVPENGDIIVTVAGKRTRLWRDKDGIAHAEDYTPLEPAPSRPGTSIPPRAKPEVPDCSEEEAKALGFAAAKANVPVIDNPFPFGDPRRPRWDEGWRLGSGNDGMGGT